MAARTLLEACCNRSTTTAADAPLLGMCMHPTHRARSPLLNTPMRVLCSCHCLRLWLEGVWSCMLYLVSTFQELLCAVHGGVRSASRRGAGVVLVVAGQLGWFACLRRRPATMAIRPDSEPAVAAGDFSLYCYMMICSQTSFLDELEHIFNKMAKKKPPRPARHS